ncbi:MSHA biogenesis protein MshK [Vibrio sinaloensis]|uniref:MSHA biogenesis protein MshK n=1 Tax=Photobacterium sp. (strain ATCC 43367) TaxID=379097 RepID=UPI003D7F8AD4
MARVLLSMLSVLMIFGVQAKQDPTAPLGWQAQASSVKKANKAPPLPKLQSIVCMTDSPCAAVLNGQSLVMGERVSGYTVRRIEQESVTLSRGDKVWKLSLFSLEVKQ